MENPELFLKAKFSAFDGFKTQVPWLHVCHIFSYSGMPWADGWLPGTLVTRMSYILLQRHAMSPRLVTYNVIPNTNRVECKLLDVIEQMVHSGCQPVTGSRSVSLRQDKLYIH